MSKVNSYKWKDTDIYKTKNDYGPIRGKHRMENLLMKI